MADQKTQRSAVNDLFNNWRGPGYYAPYPAYPPALVTSRAKRVLASAAVSVSVLLVSALAVLCVVGAVDGSPVDLVGLVAAGFFGMFVALGVDGLHRGCAFNTKLVPWTARPLLKLFKSSGFDESTIKVLEGIWKLRETIDELKAARGALDKQRSATDRSRTAEFETQARAALGRGDRDTARSLLAAKLEAEEHAAWLDEQVAQIDEQLKPLVDREFHLKTLLAVRHMQRDSLEAQTRANTARAAIAENTLLGELDVPLTLEQAPMPALTSGALEAQARALATEELLAISAAPAEPLDEETVERDLAGLVAEVQIARAAA